MKLREWRFELLLAAVVLAYNLLFLGHVGLFDVDEAIFGEATREMVETGDYITPTYNYDVRWDKPPFIYWVMSVPLRVFGPTSFGARFTSAATGAALVLLLAWFGRTVFDRPTGLGAGVAMATCLHGFLLSHMSLTDMTLTFWMAGSWIALYLATERGSPGWMLAAAAALGVGTLTKGPVALVLPGFVWLVYLLLRRETLATLKATRFHWALLLYLAVITPWCVAIYQRHGTAFYESFLGYHNLNRLTTEQSGHGGPFYTFLLVFLGGLLPWSGFALGALAGLRGRPLAQPEGRALVWLTLWLATVLGVFSLSQTKLPNYIAPAYPAGALLAGWFVGRGWNGWPARWEWLVGPSLLAVGGLGLALMSTPAWLPDLPVLRRELPGADIVLGPGPIAAGLTLVAAAITAAIIWWRRGVRAGTIAVAVGAAVSWLAVWLGVMPVVYRYQQGTIRVMAEAAVEHLDGGELATLNLHAPSIPFVVRRGFTRYTMDSNDPAARAELTARFAEPRPILMITLERRVGELLADARYYVWAQRYGWQLLGNRPPPEGFDLPPSPGTERQARRR